MPELSRQPRLGVNIDHVATLRQQRGECYPELVRAARIALENGADQITLHLREDRRHIQDRDVDHIKLLTSQMGRPLNFEMGAAADIIEKAIATQPEWICLVPEKREEQTTEGGLNLKDRGIFEKVGQTMTQLRQQSHQSKISLFLEADREVLTKAQELEVDAVEIHTGEYARDFMAKQNWQRHLVSFQAATQQLARSQIGCHAGHGLTRDSLLPLLEKNYFQEYNIGHWIIAEAVFEGLDKIVKELKQLCLKHGGVI